MVTWNQFKDLVETQLEANGKDGSMEIEYIDFYGLDVEDLDVCVDRLENNIAIT